MDKVAVVILNWNGQRWLDKFLANVVEHSKPFTVYVVDNHSDDDSLGYLSLYFPEVKTIKLEKNFGFAAGYNIGLEQIEAEYYVLLNSDVEVTPNWINPVITLLANSPNAAAAQPKLLDYYHKKSFEYAGAAGGMLDIHGVPFCKGRIFDSLEIDNGQFNAVSQIFWASGAAFFVKSSVFKQVGGFDAAFFAHMEEIDLCWRIQNAGYKILYCPDSAVYHVGGGTLNKQNPKKYYLNFRNSLWMLLKNLPASKLFPVIFVRMCLDGLAAVKMTLSGQPIMLWIVLKAHLIFYLTFFKVLAKRRGTAAKVVPEAMYKGSIIKEYYLEKTKQYSALKHINKTI